ncbi:hypothetical protein [Elstera cyanobacteriorum]|uniref:hypothetical protein n=1 Tax=Elstera cyanobacteriorum TaxID=2022747 RepID=UPI002354DAA3|nr:hypothetical protein [Elstera cyanobacteriorum]MCK6442927.1 hypothetical protein [Elstera cyanobacteriorum]
MVKRRHHAVIGVPNAAVFTDPGEDCLTLVAQKVSTSTHQTVVPAIPHDMALSWKSVAVHPMQSLETEYQGIVRDAGRDSGSPDAALQAESAALSQFFSFDAAMPRLLGVGQGEGYEGLPVPLADDQLRRARQLEKSARRGIDAALATVRPDPAGEVEAALLESWGLASLLLERFFAIPGSSRWRIPTLSQARQNLDQLNLKIETATNWQQLQRYCAQLRAALDALEDAVSGYASVQAIYFIDSFYLYRLLVPFQIETQQKLDNNEVKIEVSGALTKIITAQPWLSVWLRDKLLDLRNRLTLEDPSGNVLFFLKGGRAIKYLEGDWQQGVNDWDTQIVINPDLPPAVWYPLFRRIQNCVLLALQQYRLEFYTLLYHNAPTFQADLLRPPPPPAADPVDDAPPDPQHGAANQVPDPDPDPVTEAMGAPYRAACKSELIDVGLPRYDTVQAREQWVQLRNGIIQGPDGMPFPGYLYYINEYIAMLRQPFAGETLSAHKVPKRFERLYKLLSPTTPDLTQQLDTVVTHERALIPPQLLPLSVAAAEAQQDPALRRLLLIQLQQFSAAYALPADPGFAAAFDSFFTTNLANADALVVVPNGLQNSIAAYPDWQPAYNGLVTMIGFAQWVSDQIEAHLTDRAAFLTQQQQVMSGLVQAVAGIFSFREEWEVEFAVVQAFAAQLQADYTRYPHPEDLEPTAVLSTRLFASTPNASRETLIELVQPVVQAYVAQHAGVMVLNAEPQAGVLRVFWATPVPLGQLTYAPLVFDLTVAEPPDGWPQLSYIWGLPVLALRDLVKSYQRHTARIEEYGRRRSLRATTRAMMEIYTRANNPEPANPVLLALTDGQAPYLKLSSIQRNGGPPGDFPPSYFPAQAFGLTLTQTPGTLAHDLALPPPAAGVDRTLGLLVLNQGAGGWGTFATWTAQNLRDALVAPMLAAGIRAQAIVLDFSLSASLLPALAPLCAPDGIILSTLYTTELRVMTRQAWTAMQAALTARNQPQITDGLKDRLGVLAAINTGLSILQSVRTAQWGAIEAHIRQYPNDRDPLSIIRVLVPMGQDIRFEAANLPQLYTALAAYKQRPLPWEAVGYHERTILDLLPAQAGLMTAAVYAEILAAFTRRVQSILSDPAYGIGLPPATVAAMPLFDGPDETLWSLLRAHQPQLLALAQGLPRCPTPFALYQATGNRLILDGSLLDTPLTPGVVTQLTAVDPQAPQQVPRMLGTLQQSGAIGLFLPAQTAALL